MNAREGGLRREDSAPAPDRGGRRSAAASAVRAPEPVDGRRAAAHRRVLGLLAGAPAPGAPEEAADQHAHEVADAVADTGLLAAAPGAGAPPAGPEGGPPDVPPPQSPPPPPAAAGGPPAVRAGLESPWRGLDAGARRALQPAFAVDLATVRLHEGAVAAESARGLGARAYTVGRDIVFGAGRPGPETREGARLLAHELAHVADQARRGRALVQRWETPPEAERDYQYGLVLGQWPSRGEATLVYQDQPWIRFRWQAAPDRRLEDFMLAITRDVGPPATAGVAVQTPFPIQVIVVTATEQTMTDIARESVRFQLDFRSTGTVAVDGPTASTTSASPLQLVHTYSPRPLPPPHVEGELPGVAPPGPTPAPPGATAAPPQPARPRYWTLPDQAGFDSFAAGHPDTDWAGIQLATGEVVAWALTHEGLRRAAAQVREGRYDFEFLRDFPGAQVSGLYLHGRRLESVNDLHNLYFGEPWFAAIGSTGDLPECEVYEMGAGNYGRRPLTHAQALARWRELDALGADAIAVLESEPGHRFEGLHAQGASMLHFLELDHFQARDSFLGFAARYPNLVLSEATPELAYLLVEIDREQEDPRVRQVLTTHDELAEQLQDEIYRRVRADAQEAARQSLNEAVTQLRRLADSNDAAAAWISGFPELSREEREQRLGVIGLHRHPPGTLPLFTAILDNRQLDFFLDTLGSRRDVFEIMLGGGNVGEDLESVRDHARTSADGVQQVLDMLAPGQDLHALNVEGDIGRYARESAYRRHGFRRLRPEDYPHTGRGAFPGPLAGRAADFTTLAEQLYANRTAHLSHEETFQHIVGVTAMVAATVVLILVANAAGAAVAGALFATGTAAFTATELAVAAAAFTAGGYGLQAIATGQSPIDTSDLTAAGRQVLSDYLVNLATFGFFKMLNAVFVGASRSTVRALFAADATTAGTRAVAETGLRLGLTATSFLGFGVAQFRARNGRFPTADELALMTYESGLTLALLEVGGVLSRPYTERIGLWNRARRAGAMRSQIDALSADISALNRDLAGYAVTPQAVERDAQALVTRQQALLARQRTLVEQLRASIRTSDIGEAVDREAGVELAKIDASLSLLREAQFLRTAGIRPSGAPSAPTDPLEFTYRAGGADAIRARYGAANVRSEPDGTLRVTHEGRELIFRPEPPPGTVPAPVAGTGAVGAAPAAAPTGQELAVRRDAVVARADRLGLGDRPEITAVRRLRPGPGNTAATLRSTARLVGQAEAMFRTGPVAEQVRADAARALARHRRRLGAEAMRRVRSGELATMTDQQVGEALNLPVAQGLGEAQLRGVLFAVKGPPAGSAAEPIDLRRLFDLSRSAAERNFVLETFGRFMEARIPGTYELLSSATATANTWRGATWQFEFARLGVAMDRIASFEVTETDVLTGGERRYDIVLTDGTRLEMKDWDQWFPGSVASQFRRDVLIRTSHFADPAGLRRIHWVFRSPAPVPEADVRTLMRGALEQVMDEFSVGADVRQRLRQEFDANTDLVRASTVNRSAMPATIGGPAAPPVTPVPPPARDDDDRGPAPAPAPE